MAIVTRLLVSWLLVATTAAAADDAAPLQQLQRMNDALRELDYQGSFLYQSGSRLDTLRIFHAAGKVERERMVSLSGPRSEMLRVGKVITIIKADAQASQLPSGSASQLLPLIPAQAITPGIGYSLRASGTDRVAGYETSIIDIVPVDRYRYGYRLWLEQTHHLPLRAALISAEQRALEQLVFVSLTIGTAPNPVDLALDKTADAAQASAAEAVLSGESKWQVSDLPTGFALISRHGGSVTAVGAEHLVFGDGLASVSVYVDPTTDAVEDDVALARGAMNVYVRRTDGWRYTVLGNVPAVTVQRIALSIGKAETLAEQR